MKLGFRSIFSKSSEEASSQTEMDEFEKEQRQQIGDLIGVPSKAEEEVEEVEEAADPVDEVLEEAGEAEEVEAVDEAEAPEDPPEPDEVAQLKSELSQLRQTISQLSSQTKPSEEEVEEAQESFEQLAEQLEAVEFVKDQADLVAALRDPKKFNELMNQILGVMSQHTTRTLPRMVSATVSREQALVKARDDFYATHPDLADHKQFVGYLVSQIQQAEPELSLPQLLDKAAEMAYGQLAIHERATKREERRRESPAQPAFPSKKPAARNQAPVEPELTDQQKQISDILAIS